MKVEKTTMTESRVAKLKEADFVFDKQADGLPRF
jgi:hypothetical protein